ncbi:MAG: DUF1446 domain-containing protein [Alphaproteobacteria bacterium]|nr:DUF1446 domain-containing protein [Alphaproteobacteria bacterium]
MSQKIVRIGCSSGFWGDSAIAAPQLVHGGDIHYLVADYLAEITMSIMARARAKDPGAGFATDFVTVTMKRLLRDIAARGIRVVTNAGGVNPTACAEAIRAMAAEQGLALRVAAVLGDDLMAQAEELRRAGIAEMSSGAPLPESLMSMNAYLGAIPIAQALAAGADIVITGRCVDSALVLGPLMHEFGWRADDFDRLAAGSLAGHIIECGAQCTGGLFTDWDQVPGWENIGYPVIECAADGSFIVTKPPGTGGLVTRGTVAEQLLYEIGDPAAYILPDVICDFTAVTIEQVGENRVRVAGARGLPPTTSYKVCATYMDGWRMSAQLTIGGIDAPAKARRTAEAVLARTRAMFRRMNLADYRETHIETLGAEAMYGPHSRALGTREVVLRLAASHAERLPLEIMGRELISSGTSMSPGTTGGGGGRARAQPVVRLYSCLVPKERVAIHVEMDGASRPVAVPPGAGPRAGAPVQAAAADTPPAPTPEPRRFVPLVRLAWGRSGDKGNDSNIGIIARQPQFLPLIREQVTAERVRDFMAHAVKGEVRRFDLPGIGAVNFLLRDALGGGGIASLRNDPQGKAFAQMLLDLPVEVPVSLLGD